MNARILGSYAMTTVLFSASTMAADFQPGQRWSCITDQGAEAFLDVHSIAGGDVSFSWGVLDPNSNELTSLCNQSDRLSADEMAEFCRVLGEEFSQGHVMLQEGCEE